MYLIYNPCVDHLTNIFYGIILTQKQTIRIIIYNLPIIIEKDYNYNAISTVLDKYFFHRLLCILLFISEILHEFTQKHSNSPHVFTQSSHFNAPVLKDWGHFVLPVSVCLSVLLSVCPSICLSAQT